MSKIKDEDRIKLIKTIATFNPRIEELTLYGANGLIIEEIIWLQIGYKLKILDLKFCDIKSRSGRMMLKGLPNIQELRLAKCNYRAEMFESMPSTMKTLIVRELHYCGTHWDEEEMFDSKVVEAIARSNNASSIEKLEVDDIDSECFELICDQFLDLKSLKFGFKEQFDSENLRKLNQLKELNLENERRLDSDN